MKSLLRFLVFVAVMSAAVAVLYLWKSTEPATPGAPAASTQVPEASHLPNLAAIDREFTSLVSRVVPSVVSINAIPADMPPAAVYRQWMGGGQLPSQLGSGAIISEDGYVVTNWHVISGAGAVLVYLSDGRPLPAKFVGADPASDVAVLRIEGKNFKPLPFGNSDDLQVGQMVVAVGNPFGLTETVTRGILSAKGRRTSSEATNEFLQTDAPINPGNSGGPLVDLNGRLIGLNNSILKQTDGIGFAIPSNTVRRIFENIRDYGRVIRPWFGVYMWPLTPALAAQLQLEEPRGALIASLVEGSPAARDGVKPGDVIVSFNGREIADNADLINRIAETEPGKKVLLGVKRNGREITLETTIEKQPGE